MPSFTEIVQAVKKLNSISRARLNFRRWPILWTALYRNPIQASNFNGVFDQLFLSMFLSNFHRRCLSTFAKKVKNDQKLKSKGGGHVILIFKDQSIRWNALRYKNKKFLKRQNCLYEIHSLIKTFRITELFWVWRYRSHRCETTENSKPWAFLLSYKSAWGLTLPEKCSGAVHTQDTGTIRRFFFPIKSPCTSIYPSRSWSDSDDEFVENQHVTYYK